MAHSTTVVRYGAALASVRRRSVFDFIQSRLKRASAREEANIAHPTAEPMYHDAQLAQACSSSAAFRRNSAREEFLHDAHQAREQQIVSLDRPGRLFVNRQGMRPALETEERGELAV